MTEEEIEKKLRESMKESEAEKSASGADADEHERERKTNLGAVYGNAETENMLKKPQSGRKKSAPHPFLGKLGKLLRDGIIDNNPVLVQLLGMCSTLATTTSVKNALGMGIATSAVLICSNIMISLLRRLIPKEVRIAAYVVIISGFVTAVELLMKAYLPDLYNSLGIFIPLIVVNCIILARAESFASKNRVLPSLIDAIGMGLGYTMALLLLASVREILGAGTFCGHPVFGEGYSPAVIFILPAGAFLTLGFILAVVQKLRNSADDRARLRRLSDIGGKTGGAEQ